MRIAMRERTKGRRDPAKTSRGVRVLGQRQEPPTEILQRRGPDRRDQSASVGKALVERRSPNAHTLGNCQHRDRVEAAGLEKLSAGGDDLVVGGAGASGTHAFARPIRPRWVSWNEPGSFRP